MLRFPSGVTDQYIYFVAVDSADLITRETGLATWTVRRSRNGGASAAYTTPTINETDVTNMPGVYELLLDEDMTLDAGDHSQAVCLHITHAGMAPVTLQFELYRPDVTAGETVTVSSGAVSTVTTTTTATNVTTVNGLAAGVITAAAVATGAIDADALAADAATEVADAVWATAARTLTALDEDSTTIDLDATIAAAVPSAAAIADAVWDEDATAHQTQGTFGQAIGDPGADTDTIFGLVNTNLDATVSSRSSQASVDTIDTNVDAILVDTGTTLDGKIDAILVDTGTDIPATIADLPTNAELATALGTADDAVLAAIAALNNPTVGAIADAVWDEPLAGHLTAGSTGAELNDAGAAAPTASEIADEVETRTLDANIVQVNSITVDGVGTEANPWGPV